MTDEEYTLREEIQEKKRTASGVYHRASRRKGYKGAVKLPFETMGRQARDQYTKGGDVLSSTWKPRSSRLPLGHGSPGCPWPCGECRTGSWCG